MTAQLMKERLMAIPSDLTNSHWSMYDVVGKQITSANSTWHFTSPNDIHDDPEVWHVHWEKINEDKILIKRTNDASPYTQYQYEVIFAGSNVMVLFGSDETPNRILIGIRN